MNNKGLRTLPWGVPQLIKSELNLAAFVTGSLEMLQVPVYTSPAQDYIRYQAEVNEEEG